MSRRRVDPGAQRAAHNLDRAPYVSGCAVVAVRSESKRPSLKAVKARVFAVSAPHHGTAQAPGACAASVRTASQPRPTPEMRVESPSS